jgi:hypothetical protein
LSASEVSTLTVAVDSFTSVSLDTEACTAATSAQTAELAWEPLAAAAVDEGADEPDEPDEPADGEVLEVHPAASSMTPAVLTLSAAAFHGTKLVIIKLLFPPHQAAGPDTSRAPQVGRPAPKSPLHSYRVRPMSRCGARRLTVGISGC